MDNRYEQWQREQRAREHSRRQAAFGQPGPHNGNYQDGSDEQHGYEGDRDWSQPHEYRQDNRRYRQEEGYRGAEPGGYEQIMGSRRPPRDSNYPSTQAFRDRGYGESRDYGGAGARYGRDERGQQQWEDSDYRMEPGRYADLGGPQYGMEAGWRGDTGLYGPGAGGYGRLRFGQPSDPDRQLQWATPTWPNNPATGLSAESGDADLQRARERYAERTWREQQSHRGRGPKEYERSDERIREDICERLTDDPYIDASEVSVSVKSGVVTLEGTVHQRSLKHRIEDMADRCGGVKDVQNRLNVARPGSQPDTGGRGRSGATGNTDDIGNATRQ